MNKERKGMPYVFMTGKEQEVIAKHADIYYDDTVGKWMPIDGIDPKQYVNFSYWCSSWDKLMGEALIGKLCFVSEPNAKKIQHLDLVRIVGFTIPFLDKEPYYTCSFGRRWPYARQIKLSEIKDMIDMGA